MTNKTQQNLVFIFADQFREESLPIRDPNVIAPNLQKLIDEGISLTRTYTSNPVCTPARASIISGLYSHTHGLITNNLRLRTDITSIAHVYRDHGYRTGYIGKWHMDGEEKPGFVPPGPRRQGFDYWAAFNRGHNYWDSVYYRDEPVPIQAEGYEPDYQTDLAVSFIEDNKGVPFCLFMSWGPPHTPFHPEQGRDDRWNDLQPDSIQLRPNVPANEANKARQELAGYNTHITALDQNLGKIIEALDVHGLSANTILVFTSDHGDMLGSQGLYRKGRPLEEAIHIPFIIRFPSKLGRGTENEALFHTVDFMPTLLALSGLEVPTAVQGNDLSQAIVQNDPNLGPEAVYIEGKMGQVEEFRAIRTKRHLLALELSSLKTTHLYDTAEDPFELNNKAGQSDSEPQERQLRHLLFTFAAEKQDRLVTERIEALGEDALRYEIKQKN
ncbi:sulfatase [Paenibacillus allorhizosphaerae]|uniref:Ulvan-active sulfatase n=1 Tax=Paenibacillus allorhizosphaerae TaxID=2849866 RepID=A0ABM8V9Z1_9BACL|nr:sulfatase [Paenibacillus allorhizosphaerae]CAG7613941.1 Ulvan-active sulfatase [Paenibacillus allorhizosphaerae]